jgi:uncharacterized membrane protein YadS
LFPFLKPQIALFAGFVFALYGVFCGESNVFFVFYSGSFLKRAKYNLASETAICGGSAIATIGSVAKADKNKMLVSLATIFFPNAIGLFGFPVLGHCCNLHRNNSECG